MSFDDRTRLSARRDVPVEHARPGLVDGAPSGWVHTYEVERRPPPVGPTSETAPATVQRWVRQTHLDAASFVHQYLEDEGTFLPAGWELDVRVLRSRPVSGRARPSLDDPDCGCSAAHLPSVLRDLPVPVRSDGSPPAGPTDAPGLAGLWALDAVVGTAVAAVPGAVGGCLLRVDLADGVPVAWTSDRSRSADELALALGQGSGLGAADGRRLVLVADLEAERRWPRWGRAVHARYGWRSAMSIPLQVPPAQAPNVVLTLYGQERSAFDDVSNHVVRLIASHVALAVSTLVLADAAPTMVGPSR